MKISRNNGTTVGSPSGRALVGIDEALQEAGLQALDRLAPVLRGVNLGPCAVQGVGIVGPHAGAALQPGAVLSWVHHHPHMVHRFRHCVLALRSGLSRMQ